MIRFPSLHLGSGFWIWVQAQDMGWDPCQGQDQSQGFSQGFHCQNLSQVPQAHLQYGHGGLLHEVELIVMGCYTNVETGGW